MTQTIAKHDASLERIATPAGGWIAIEPRGGHSQTAASRKAVEEFGVHEKDMPTEYIAQLGDKVGFDRHLILPRSHDLMRSLYRPGYSRGTGVFNLKILLFLSKLRAIRRLFDRDGEKFIVLWK